MKIEITGIKPLSAYEKERNAEALEQYNAEKENGTAPETYEAPNRERPDTLTIEDGDDKSTLILTSGSYGDPLRVSIEDLKRALKIF